MNIWQALDEGRRALACSSSAQLDARLLLQHVLGQSHAFLVAHGDEAISPAQENAYRALIERAQAGEPIPYITGEAPFYGLTLQVSPAVLIPRPETEQLVEKALDWAEENRPAHAVDVGTGSGCIAITLARELRDTKITAVDLSPEALDMARNNAGRYGLDERIDFVEGHLLDSVEGSIDLLVANLPYVRDDEWAALDDSVKWYEPSLALRGGADGLELMRELLSQARSRLRPGGAIFLEIGWQQGAEGMNIAHESFPEARVETGQDYAGRDRFIIVYL